MPMVGRVINQGNFSLTRSFHGQEIPAFPVKMIPEVILAKIQETLPDRRQNLSLLGCLLPSAPHTCRFYRLGP